MLSAWANSNISFLLLKDYHCFSIMKENLCKHLGFATFFCMQCDFQVIYASAIKGQAGLSPENLAEDLGPLFESIIRCIPGPRIDKDGALQMLVSCLLYSF